MMDNTIEYMKKQNKNLFLSLLVLIPVVLCLSVVIIVLAFKISQKEVIFKSINHQLTSGVIPNQSYFNFGKEFLYMMHHNGYYNIKDRNELITSYLCPNVENSFFTFLENDARQIAEMKTSQEVKFSKRGNRVIQEFDNGKTIEIPISKRSKILKENIPTYYDEIYRLKIMVEGLQIGRQNLCIKAHQRVKSEVR